MDSIAKLAFVSVGTGKNMIAERIKRFAARAVCVDKRRR
jgi:hypothetical protein